MINAVEAKAMGLVNSVYPSDDDLMLAKNWQVKF